MVESQTKVLIVDDEADNIRILEVLLLRRGYTVIKARNGAEALQQVYSEQPDIILLDVMMPIMDGFQVLRWVRQQPSLAALRILVLTSSDSLKDVNLAYKLGANSFLVKPCREADLLNLITCYPDLWTRLSPPGSPSVSPEVRTG